MSTYKTGLCSLLVCTIASLSALHVYGQALTVFSSGENARNCYYEAGMVDQTVTASRRSIAWCSKALQESKLSPRDTAATLLNRGILLGSAGMHVEARADFNQAIQIKHDLPEPYVGRGNLLFMEKQFALAIDEYSMALDMGIKRAHVVLFNRALAYEADGQTESARADLQAALNLRPDFKFARDSLDMLEAKNARKAAPSQ